MHLPLRKTYHLSLFVLLLLLSSCASLQQSREQKALRGLTPAQIVEHLASDAMEGRAPGSAGMEKATVFVESFFQALNIEPFFPGSYRDTFYVYREEAYNIVGVLRGSKPNSDYILIGAHLDHLGMTPSTTDSVFNGANDNASGVAAVLHIARELSRHRFDQNVLLVLFSAEESGLDGSWHLARRLKEMELPLSYMINFDMIGKPLSSGANRLFMTGYHRSNMAQAANALLQEEFLIHEDHNTYFDLFQMSDNYPFYRVLHIPAHTLIAFDLQNDPYYHDVRDEFSALDLNHLNYVIDRSAKMISLMLQQRVEVKLAK